MIFVTDVMLLIHVMIPVMSSWRHSYPLPFLLPLPIIASTVTVTITQRPPAADSVCTFVTLRDCNQRLNFLRAQYHTYSNVPSWRTTFTLQRRIQNEDKRSSHQMRTTVFLTSSMSNYIWSTSNLCEQTHLQRPLQLAWSATHCKHTLLPCRRHYSKLNTPITNKITAVLMHPL